VAQQRPDPQRVAASLLAAWRAAPQPDRSGNCPSYQAARAPSHSSPAAPSASAALDTYTGTDFSIGYPTGWQIKASEAAKSFGTDTTIADPSDDASLVRVDVSAKPATTSAMSQAQPVVDALRHAAGYREIDLTDSGSSVHWEFEDTEHGRTVHKEDVFFTDQATGYGVAVLTQAPTGSYEQLRATFDDVRASYGSG
jgi:hypothetical protein